MSSAVTYDVVKVTWPISGLIKPEMKVQCIVGYFHMFNKLPFIAVGVKQMVSQFVWKVTK